MARFKQGESGNPEGRPKGSISITTAIRDKLQEVNPKTKRQYLYDLVDVMVEKAVKEKDFRVIKEIWNHIDGSPRQTTEMVGNPVMLLSISRESEERFSEQRQKSNQLIKQYLETTHGQ